MDEGHRPENKGNGAAVGRLGIIIITLEAQNK